MEGLTKLVAIKAYINLGLLSELKTAFPIICFWLFFFFINYNYSGYKYLQKKNNQKQIRVSYPF